MKQFEYEITRHDARSFSRVEVFCTGEGQCNLEAVPEDHVKVLADILNHRGQAGWELVQLAFGQGGLLAFWKRELIMD